MLPSPFCGRDEATRTPDPYVPNVVRYQLRYIPMFRSFCGIVIPQKNFPKKKEVAFMTTSCSYKKTF